MQRAKDVLTSKAYVNIVKQNLTSLGKAYKGGNFDHVASSYEPLLTAVIQATPRVSKVHLQAAAVNVFGVNYLESKFFSTAINNVFQAIGRKSRTVTSGTRQAESVLRLVELYKRTWGSADEEPAAPESDEDVDVDTAPSEAASSAGPSWESFTSRFSKGVKVRIFFCMYLHSVHLWTIQLAIVLQSAHVLLCILPMYMALHSAHVWLCILPMYCMSVQRLSQCKQNHVPSLCPRSLRSPCRKQGRRRPPSVRPSST